MPKKVTRKGIRNKLDGLVKELVKLRDNYTCQHCGKSLEKSNCHGSHVIPVSKGLLWAYDPMNIKVLCFRCHINWWHKNPLESARWFNEKFPERAQYLENKRAEYANRPVKIWELEAMVGPLEEELSKYK